MARSHSCCVWFIGQRHCRTAQGFTSVTRVLASIGLLVTVGSAMISNASAQTRDADLPVAALQRLDAAVESLVATVSRSVVQVLVTTYGPVPDRDGADLIIGRQRAAGSGVVVDRGGYIVTNAHVLTNARRIEVMLPRANDGLESSSAAATTPRRVDAKIVGIAPEIDLAVIKVEEDLPVLPMADYDRLRQGALVFAFGSPEGLRDSVTMGVVSSVARQPNPDSPLVYVQTDASINSGNSGGPLVNVRGELVGINTFILSATGGNQGLGFAIPSALVQIAYPKLRQYGHLHRGEVGILLQTNTPLLAKGLGLSQSWGPLVADVVVGSPAEKAGLRVKDIIVSVDGQPVDSVPRVGFRLFTLIAGDRVSFGVLRGANRLTLGVTATERETDLDWAAGVIDPDKSVIGRLGVLAADIGVRTRTASSRRPPSVMVVGHTREEADGADTGLIAGDIIRTINGAPVTSVEQLRAFLATLPPRSIVVLHVDRNGQMTFLGFELD